MATSEHGSVGMPDMTRRLEFVCGDTTKLANLRKLEKLAKREGYNVHWTKSEQIHKMKYENDVIYVLDPFSGRCFQHLKRIGARIIGPQCVEYSIAQKRPLIDSPYPIYNLAMKDLVICCTNLSKNDRDELHSLVKMMAGKVNPHLTTDVTHLVAGEVGSEKYKVALSLAKSIVSPTWITESWKLSQNGVISSLEEEFMNKHLCPIFSGCTICVTGLDKEERGNINKLILTNGGAYSPELNQKCTHLLVNVPKGDKYEYALQWNIHCVQTKWFYDSLKAKGALSENKYTCVKRSAKSNEHTDSQEIALSSAIRRLSQAKSFEENKNNDSEDMKFNITIPKHSSFFLDGCKILLDGFNEVQQTQLQNAINSAGGTRFNILEDSVTHVVISKSSTSDPTIANSLKSQPFFVSADWLVESCKDGIRLSEDDYLITAKANQTYNKSMPLRKRKNVRINPTESDHDDIAKIFNQYVPADDIKEGASKLFDDKKICIHGFMEIHVPKLRLIIETNGGEVITSSLQADLIVTPPCIYKSEDGKSSLKGLTCVTTYYLEDCLEIKKLKDIKESVFYKPFDLPPGAMPLNDCVLSISQFSGSLRNYLIELIQFLGGRFQDQLVRVQHGNLYPTTHLLIIEPEGSKYNAAKKWKIPTISEKWLLACAEESRKVEESGYLIGEGITSPATTENQNTKPIVQPALNQDDNLKPHEIVVGPNAAYPSFADAAGNDLSNVCEKSIIISDGKKKFVEDNKENGNPTKAFEGAATILRGVIISASKKLSSSHGELKNAALQLGAEWRWTLDDSCTHFIYQGRLIESNKEIKAAKKAKVILVSPYWLKACLSETYRQEEMHYPTTYNPKLNLAVLSKTEKEFKSSTPKKDEPARKKRRTTRNLSLDNNVQNLHEKTFDESTVQQDIIQKELTGFETSGYVNEIENQEDSNREGTLESREDFKRHVDELMEVTRVTRSSRKKSRKSLSCTPDSKDIPTSGEASNTNQTTRRITRRMSQNFASKITSGEPASASLESTSDYSQMEAITYDDPAGRLERERIKARLRRNRSGGKTDSEHDDLSESCISNDRAQNNTGRQSPASFGVQSNTNIKLLSVGVDEVEGICSPSPAKVQYRFLLSAMKPQEKINYADIVESLNGVFYDTQYFTQACTHVVVGDINRNEKCLAAMASGKWLLRKSFLDASQKAGRFVSEEKHEWGFDSANSSLSKLAIAARRWRKKVQEENRNRKLQGIIGDPYGAFKGWKILLSVDVTRQSGFKRLLEAGCATVMKVKPPFPDIEGVTHAFIDTNRTKPGSIDLQQLINANIACLKPDYIAEYLTQDPPPNPDSFVLPEIQNLMKSK